MNLNEATSVEITQWQMRIVICLQIPTQTFKFIEDHLSVIEREWN
jgi:hypothetical protein